jgi:hypothetical protein
VLWCGMCAREVWVCGEVVCACGAGLLACCGVDVCEGGLGVR